MANTYDALILVSFGGPECRDDVLPFLENVLRGKPVPHERMLEVAEHYYEFDGISPINAQNRRLVVALQQEFADHGLNLPIYWGNRNWHPMLTETLRQMATDGVGRALAFVTTTFSCYSGCRQYREDIAQAQEAVGPAVPEVEKLRVFFNHPGFIEPMIDRLREGLAEVPPERRSTTRLLFTAHSIPRSMAENSRYEAQLHEACRLVAEGAGHSTWQLVYQSRSGPPQQPWLEPDICDVIQKQHARGDLVDVVVVPIGFVSDHMEVLFDLDTEAQEVCKELGVNMLRVPTVGTDPRFVSMIRELVEERQDDQIERKALGAMGPGHDVCPSDCCLYTPSRSGPG